MGPEHRLRQRWRADERPDVDAFIAEARAVSFNGLVAIVRVDQGERWCQGERVPAEDYLQRYPALQSGDEALDLVYAECGPARRQRQALAGGRRKQVTAPDARPGPGHCFARRYTATNRPLPGFVLNSVGRSSSGEPARQNFTVSPSN